MKKTVSMLSIATTLLCNCIIGLDQNPPTQENPMQQYTVVQKPSITMIGIKCKTSNAPEAGALDIPALWKRFCTEETLAKIPNKTSTDILALYCEYEGDYTKPYSLIIGCQVSSTDIIPEGMVAKTIPATSYASFQATGEYPKTLIETWGKIWQTNLKRTYSGDFEFYGSKFSNTPPEVEVFIAIE